MGLKEDALDFAKSEALPDWEKAAKKRDPYIPRTLIPKKEHESSRRGGVFSLLGFTEIKDENLYQVPMIMLHMWPPADSRIRSMRQLLHRCIETEPFGSVGANRPDTCRMSPR